jgi:hypothetical protein
VRFSYALKVLFRFSLSLILFLSRKAAMFR